MDVEDKFSQLASLIGEPARARMLWNLLDGRALTATELALLANVSPQSASMHLNKLVQSDLLKVEHQGRHRYYQFTSRDVAYAIEAIANLLPGDRNIAQDSDLRNGHIQYCRTCYDHLAGKIGVSITDAILKKKLLLPAGSQYEITPAGRQWFSSLGIDTAPLQNLRRSFARQCLDWSERRHHLAGSLGAAFLDKMLSDDWVRRSKNSRVIVITGKGEKKFGELLGLTI